MQRALELAARGGRAAMPNPMVGAVVVHNNKIVGEGYHKRYGGPHAEVHAIQAITDREILKHATLYVSLEPCSHFGKTPPCADLILRSQIPTVVVGCRDPFPEVSGRGIQKLRDAGVTVIEDVLASECIMLNKRFITAHRNKRPYVILKWAETADGFIAPSDRARTWISCEASQTLTHQWRAEEMAIMVGYNTARFDDPALTVRHVAGNNPLRVTVDNTLSLSTSLKIFNNEAETLVLNSIKDDKSGNCEWKRYDPTLSATHAVLTELYARNVTSVIIEGGAKTLQEFIDRNLWDEARVFVGKQRFGDGIKAPIHPTSPQQTSCSGDDTLHIFFHPQLEMRLGLPFKTASDSCR
jgi:diaminohydroxyphosphoribosylaminopyrimidine deaminase/5-amino-6-(5-phosphoribosylamino)uracil reductase